MTDYSTTVGKRLRRLRRYFDLTQARVAELTGVQLRSLGDWERGVHMPTSANLSKLAALYGVSVDSLLR